MIANEIRKHIRRLRWPLIGYVVWLVTAAALISGNVAYTSESPGWRALASFIERWEGHIALIWLGFLMFALWFEDSLWNPREFWLPRPISLRANILAKVTLLVVLALVLPLAAGIVTNVSAGVGGLEFVASVTRRTLVFLSVGMVVSVFVMVVKSAAGILGLALLHLLAALPHLVFLAHAEERAFPIMEIYGAAFVLSAAIGIYVALRTHNAVICALFLLISMSVMVPAAAGLALTLDLDERLERATARWALGDIEAKPGKTTLTGRRINAELEFVGSVRKFHDRSTEYHWSTGGVSAWLPTESSDQEIILDHFTHASKADNLSSLTNIFEIHNDREALIKLNRPAKLRYEAYLHQSSARELAVIPLSSGTSATGPGFKVYVESEQIMERDAGTEGRYRLRYWYQKPVIGRRPQLRFIQRTPERDIEIMDSDRHSQLPYLQSIRPKETSLPHGERAFHAIDIVLNNPRGEDKLVVLEERLLTPVPFSIEAPIE